MSTISFNGPGKCIGIQYGAGEDSATIEWQQIYSDWVDWVGTAGGANTKWLPAFSCLFFEKTPTEKVGPFFFILNGWVICPIPYLGIESTTLILKGECVPGVYGTPIIDYDEVPPGQHTHVETKDSANVLTVGSGTAPPTANEVRDAVWSAIATTMADRGTTGWAMRKMMSVLLAKSNGHPSAPTFRDIDDTVDEITFTLDGNGNKTTVNDEP